MKIAHFTDEVMRIRICHLFAVVLLFSTIHSPTADADAFTTHLSGQTIRGIVYDDHRQLMWFGSEEGQLISYDGVDFRLHEPPPEVSLPQMTIYDIAIDRDYNLVLGTFNAGIVTVDPDKKIWRKYGQAEGFTDNLVYAVEIDAWGRIWAATNDGGVGVLEGTTIYRFTTNSLQRWDGNSWVMEKTYENDSHRLKAIRVRAFAPTHDDKMWIGTELGASLLSVDTLQSCKWDTSFDMKSIRSAFEDNFHCAWFGTSDSLHKLSKDRSTWEFLPSTVPPRLQGRAIFAIGNDGENRIWFGTDRRGAPYYDPHFKVWGEKSSSADFNSKLIHSVAHDEDGNIWFGTSASVGVYKFKSNWLAYSTTNDDSLAQLRSNRILSLTVTPNDQVWIGTEGGTARLDSGRWHHNIYFPRNGPPDALDPRNQIWDILPASDGALWLAAGGNRAAGGVLKVDGKGNVIDSLRMSSSDTGLTSNFVTALANFNNTLWIGTDAGLTQYDLVARTWRHFTAESDSLPSNLILDLAVDSRGTLWCATSKGASRYDGKWSHFTRLTVPQIGVDGINAITIDEGNDRVWLATAGAGVAVLANSVWQRIRAANGLADDFVNNVQVEPQYNRIWLVTGRGVSVLSPDGQWSTYTEVDGLPVNNVRRIAFMNGDVWLGLDSKGIVRYRPLNRPPQTKISTMIDVTTSSEIVYRFQGEDQNTGIGQLRYSHKIDNGVWSPYENDAFVRLTGLERGMHTFYVKAIDKDQNEDPSPATDSFFIVDPDTGEATITTDYNNFGQDSIRVELYWPPYQLERGFELAIEPADASTLAPDTIFAYDFLPYETNISENGILLAFEFANKEWPVDQRFAIFQERDSTGSEIGLRLGGTQSRTESGLVRITTEITQFGRYSVRREKQIRNDILGTITETTRVTPRVFSPLGGGHAQQATISFALKSPGGNVRLSVFNLAGRLVWTSEESLSAGVNAIVWNGHDYKGNVCPSGLYIIVLEGTNFISPPQPQKVMVLNATSPN